MLTDTVGFIRKLPHRLVESFKATLEEVVEADLLLHVVDISHPQANEQIDAVNAVLDEIGAAGKQVLMIFNKLDQLATPEVLHRYTERFPNSVGISAVTGEGLPNLLHELSSQLKPARDLVDLRVPYQDSATIAKLHALGQVVEQNYEDDGMARFKARIPPHLRSEFEQYRVNGQPEKPVSP